MWPRHSQIVSYIADKGGYRPTIQYIGKGVHPPPPPAYAHVQVPAILKAHPVPAIPQAHVAPIILPSPTPTVAAVVAGGPHRVHVSPHEIAPLAQHHQYGGFGGRIDPNQYYGQQPHYYEPVFAGSKISKKRALLYNKTLFRKDVEKTDRKKKRNASN